MDLHVSLGPMERVEGARAWLGYLVGAVVGAIVALPILEVVFGADVPVL
jgi:uncharacterized membrane protein YeaQ/YmgE (transglycosylase-associated protein family)